MPKKPDPGVHIFAGVAGDDAVVGEQRDLRLSRDVAEHFGQRDQQRDLWAVQNTSTNNTSIGVLRAYDATNLAAELYNSATVPADNIQDNKFITPTITNGKVYVGTPDSVAVCLD